MRIKFGRLSGALVVAVSLSLAAPTFAHDSPGGGGGGGGGSGGSDSGGSTPTSAPASVPTLATARADIAAGNWTKAIADLKAFLRANSKSPDGWNLLGYSYRNHGDLKLADAAYDHALKLDPNHKGALSYQGILYVKLGETDEAKSNLAKIAKICGNTTCVEYVELAKALG